MNDPRRPAGPTPSHTENDADTSRSEVDATRSPPGSAPDDDATRVGSSVSAPAAAFLHVIGGYVVVRKIGEGGMGAVYLTEDPKLGRKVAVKTMKPALAADKANRDRFEREARAAAAVEHENIVPIWGIGEAADGSAYIAMPFLQGEMLDARLKRQPVAGLNVILKVAREVADGLAAAHAKGLIHRDIKPGNVWLEGDLTSKELAQQIRRCKILDFGLARSVDTDDAQLTASGVVLGTPAYMAPEQARGEKVDHRADLWSLGVMLYRMAAGRLPFQGVNTMAMLFALAADTPTPVRSLNPNLPPALADLIDRLMQKNPAARPQSAAEVSATVRQIVRDLQAKPSTSGVAVPAVPAAPDPHAWEEVTEPEPKPAPPPKAARPAPVKAEPRPTRAPKRKRPANRNRTPVYLAGAAAVFAAIAVAVMILRVETPEGTLVVEINDPDVEVRVKNGKLVLVGPDGKERYSIAPSDRNKTIAAGAYKVRVEGADGLVLDTPEFTLKKGGVVTVRVTLDPRVAAKRPGPTPPAVAAFKNAVGMEFVKVPKGTGWLGGGGGKEGTVKVAFDQDFYLGKYEVTQEEWVRVMGTNPSGFTRSGDHRDAVKDVPDADLKRFPVEGVTWAECQEFIEKLNEKTKETGWVYRLPTEAEWEYACRGGPVSKADSAFDYYLAKPTNTLLPDQANFKSGNGELRRPCKVGSYPPNVLGLHDMHGNIHEMCDDRLTTPNGPTRPSRGATAVSEVAHLRASFRTESPPSSRFILVGLRVARVPTGKASEPAVADPERRAAEWVLAVGGEVGVRLPPENAKRMVTVVKDLPAGPLTVAKVSFNGLGTRVTDDGLVNLKGCKSIQEILIWSTEVSDAGVAHLKDLTSLEDVTLGDNPDKLTDASVKHLKGLSGLRKLCLNYSGVTNAGLIHLKGCLNLSELGVSNTRVTGAGLAAFKGHPELRTLTMDGNPISDSDVGAIVDLPELRNLYLNDTQIGDTGLMGLTKLKHLTRLRIEKTRVTAKGVTDLEKAMPRCKIEWDGGVIEPRVKADAGGAPAVWLADIGTIRTQPATARDSQDGIAPRIVRRLALLRDYFTSSSTAHSDGSSATGKSALTARNWSPFSWSRTA